MNSVEMIFAIGMIPSHQMVSVGRRRSIPTLIGRRAVARFVGGLLVDAEAAVGVQPLLHGLESVTERPGLVVVQRSEQRLADGVGVPRGNLADGDAPGDS
jgi:hypothetical protein